MMKSMKSYFAPEREAKETPKCSAVMTEKPSGKAAYSPTAASPVLSCRPVSGSPTEKGNDIKCEMMITYLYQQQSRLFFSDGSQYEGVVLKKSRGSYTYRPNSLATQEGGFVEYIERLNVRCAMTVSSDIVKICLQNKDRGYVPLNDGLRLQVLANMSQLPTCQKHQFAALIADRGIAVVWDDDPQHLMERATNIEASLMDTYWNGDNADGLEEEKKEATVVRVKEVADADSAMTDFEGLEAEPPRRIVLIQPIMTGVTIILACTALGAGWYQIAEELASTKSYLRLAFLAVVPAQFWLALFFFQSLVSNIAQLIGPVSQMHKNSKYYSGLPPRRLHVDDQVLPHVTIQCPVYKEGLNTVIMPTIYSIKAAISTYEMQGGTANIFINDDGMQLLGDDEARARQDFYEEHAIGWVARPPHDPNGALGGAPFHRRGKFKKASNMNYAMWISQRIEDKLAGMTRNDEWSQQDEALAYGDALLEVVNEDEGRTWCDGNIRFGDYILLVDSNTRVPKDCLLNAVSELEQSPEVAILQYSSGVMNVTNSFFEAAITFFTNMVYTQIRYAVANGDVSPFVGHNAVLRWSAIQEIAYECEEDHHEKYWSENTVSEDFDMALRLQNVGFVARLGAYTGDGFKEGVSLTVYDELARWEKYAYGCSELVFHPLKHWFTKGPLTPLFKQFMRSGMPVHSKFTIMAYVGTYYALGSAWLLTLMNYFALGWFNGYLDKYYIDSFKVYLAILVVFTAFGNISLAVLRYRVKDKSLLGAFVENFKWAPVLLIFLGGVSMHVSQAITCHLVSIDMSWGATRKEADNTTFFDELPRLYKGFRFTFLYCILVAAIIVTLALYVPEFWRIKLFIAIFPLAASVFNHFMLPIVLNPNLMLFRW